MRIRHGDLFVEFRQNRSYFWHYLLGVLHTSCRSLDGNHYFLLEFLLGLALADQLLEGIHQLNRSW